VRLLPVDGIPGGTGFFVGGGHVVTCAHTLVRRSGRPEVVKLNWRGKTHNATVRTVLPEPEGLPITRPDAYPFPDLALLEIGFREHPCVYLHDVVRSGDNVFSYGYTDEYPAGDSAFLVYEGPSDDGRFLRLRESQVRSGLSGGPLLNIRTGAVVGLVKRTRGPNQPLGSRGVPTAAIVANLPELTMLQREFHLGDSVWVGRFTRAQADSVQWHRVATSLPSPVDSRWVRCNGPFGGTISALAVDPDDSDVLYAGMALGEPFAGLYKSVDGGRTWFDLDLGVDDRRVKALAVSPDGTLFVATPRALYRSDDRGWLWQQVDQGPSSEEVSEVRCVAVSELDPKRMRSGRGKHRFSTTAAGGTAVAAAYDEGPPLLAAAGPAAGDAQLTDDGGRTWQTLRVRNVNAWVMSRLDDRIEYLGTSDDGVYRAVDGAWRRAAALDAAHVFSLAVSPTDPAHLLAGTDDGLFESRDGGDSWRRVSEVGHVLVAAVTFSPAGERIFAGVTGGVFESRDDGRTFRAINRRLAHPRVMSLAAPTGGALYAGTDGGGVFKRPFADAAWLPSSTGLATVEVLTIALWDSDLVFVGTNVGVFRTDDGGGGWEEIGYFDAHPVLSLALTGARPGEVVDASAEAEQADVFLSTDAGDTWRGLSAVNPDIHVYAGTSDGSIYRSGRDSASWEPVARLAGGRVRQLAVSPEDPNVILAVVEGGGVFRSVDAAATWVGVDGGPDSRTISIHHALHEAKTVYAGTYGEGVRVSRDGGASWQPCDAGLPGAPIYAIADAAHDGTIFVATDGAGVFRGLKGGREWRAASEPRPDPRMSSLAVLPNGQVVAGTWTGRIYRSRDEGDSWEQFDEGLPALRPVNGFGFSPSGRPAAVYAISGSGVFKTVLP
jgi:photosystem II stability/assembly factor-like uncharacterized protein